MLPDISRRNSIRDVFNRQVYDSKVLHSAIDMDPKFNDGCTSKNAVKIVQDLNEYINQTCLETIFYVFTAVSFYVSIINGAYDDSDVPFLKFYSDPAIKDFSKVQYRQLWGIAKSLASQRRLAVNAKNVAKNNKLNKDWENLYIDFIKRINDRITYIRKLIVPEHIKFTPMHLLTKELESDGISMRDYIYSIKPDWSSEFDVDSIADQVSEFILKKADTKQLSIWQNELMDYVLAQTRRKEMNRLMAENEAKQEREQVAERVKNDVESVCGFVSNNFTKNICYRKQQLLSAYAEIYVIVCARVSRSKDRTEIRYGKGVTRVLSPVKLLSNASVYKSEAEANHVIDILKRKYQNDIICEIAYIDNPAM